MPATLPNFFILGAERCGTTSLHQYLKQHPDVYMPHVKEPGYFVYQGADVPEGVGEFTTTFEEYVALFADADGHEAIGEASPFYLYRSSVAALRIKELVPDARLVVGLRNPVERAYSQYRVVVRHGFEKLPDFGTAVTAESRRVEAGADLMYHYTRQSLYLEHLERYLELFGRDRLHVYLFDDFEANPVRVVQGIWRFLGVDPTFVPAVSRRLNGTRGVRSRLVRRLVGRPNPLRQAAAEILPARTRRRVASRIRRANLRPHEIDPVLKRRLLDLFRDDIAGVASLLDLDLRSWLRDGDGGGGARRVAPGRRRRGRP